MVDRPFIRDALLIDIRVQRFYNSHSGPGPVFLLAHSVSIESGFIFRVWSKPLVIICDHFDGNGGWISASGEPFAAAEFERSPPIPGARGEDGIYPWPDKDAQGRPVGPGGDGRPGSAGSAGYPGMDVVLRCRSARNLWVTTQGGQGAPGGAGGNGTRGVDGYTVYDGNPNNPHYDYVDGTQGGFGGMGGVGGAGGPGGSLVVTSLEDVPDPILITGGGAGGPGGPHGQSGEPGRYAPPLPEPTDLQSYDPSGPMFFGPSGPSGDGPPARIETVAPEQLLAIIRQDLMNSGGRDLAEDWVPFRMAVANYQYHYHEPTVAERAGALERAVDELQAVLALRPGHEEALQLLQQIQGTWIDHWHASDVFKQDGVPDILINTPVLMGGGANALGYSPNLDIIPRFRTYIDDFARFQQLDLAFLNIAVQDFLHSTTIGGMQAFAGLKLREAEDAVRYQEEELGLAETELEIAEKHAEFTAQSLADVQVQIEAAEEKLKQEEFSFGDLTETLFEVGSAVAMIAGAIPTGGVSLVGLVPSLVQIQNQISNSLTPIAKTLMTIDPSDVEDIANAFKKVKKDPSSLLNGNSTVVNFVNLVNKVAAGGAQASPAQVALVQRGIELVRENLLAGYEVQLARDRKQVVLARIGRARSAVQLAADTEKNIGDTANKLRQLGLVALRTAQVCVGSRLNAAFLAKRSLEIYTSGTGTHPVFLDTGMIPPDSERDFEEGLIQPYDLVSALQKSWSGLNNVADLQLAYTKYLLSAQFQQITLPHNISDQQSIGRLRASRKLEFKIDLNEFPQRHFEARLLHVWVALVGADAHGKVVRYRLTHGPVYLLRMRDGSIREQALLSRSFSDVASTAELTSDDMHQIKVDPENAPITTPFWGRGVAGEWTLEIEDGGAGSAPVGLENVSKVQVWVQYLFVRQ
jgi:hypothetical protein